MHVSYYYICDCLGDLDAPVCCQHDLSLCVCLCVCVCACVCVCVCVYHIARVENIPGGGGGGERARAQVGAKEEAQL